MANARSLGYLHQRMLERAEDAAAALRAAIGPTTTDLATLQQQQQQQLQQQQQQQQQHASLAGTSAFQSAADQDDDDDDADSTDDGGTRGSTSASAANPYLAGILASLDSSSDDARIDGLRRIIAAIAAGRYRIAHAALPAVLKLTSSSITSLHVRKLVSIILARSASAQPDLALLAVNSFQRDLAHHAPLIRASALRALGSLRIPVLAPILRLAIASAARDSHPHVRRVAALSLSKAYALDPSARPELTALLIVLFNDRSPSVLGAALVAYSALGYPAPQSAAAGAGAAPTHGASAANVYDYDVDAVEKNSTGGPAPSQESQPTTDDTAETAKAQTQYALLHPFYRKLCYALADMDEWTQSHALDVLLLYARTNFAEPSTRVLPAAAASSAHPGAASSSAHAPRGKEREKQDIEAFFADDEPAEGGSVAAAVMPETAAYTPASDEKAAARRNADLDLLLSRAQPLLMSRNPAVVLSVVRLTFYLSPAPRPGSPPSVYTHALIRPLLRYVRPSSSSPSSTPPELAYLAILNLAHLTTSFPALLPALQPHLPAFLPRSASADEPLYLSLAKIDILVALCGAGNVVGAGWVLSELEWLSRGADGVVGGPACVSGSGGGGGGGEDEEDHPGGAGAADGGRLARRAVGAIGEVVARVREGLLQADGGASSEAEREQDRAEVAEITERALEILLRLIRGGSASSSEDAAGSRSVKSNGSRSASAGAHARKAGRGAGPGKGEGEGEVPPGVVARAITVLRSLLPWQSSSASPTSAGADSATPSPHELSTGRILAHFPVLLFGAPPSSSSSSAAGAASSSTTATTTTTVNAEGKTVQIIRRPRILGRGAIRDAEARTNLFWLLGQHCRTRVAVAVAHSLPTGAAARTTSYVTLAELVGPDLLRRAALNFANESVGTKVQILTFAAKLGAFFPLTAAASSSSSSSAATSTAAAAAAVVVKKVDALVGYVMQLGRYDADYDVRDRARFCKALARGLVLPPLPSPGAAVASSSSLAPAAAAGQSREEGQGQGAERRVEAGAGVAQKENAEHAKEGEDGEEEEDDEEEEEVGGVTLRREQVLMILFEGKVLGGPAASDAQEEHRGEGKHENDSGDAEPDAIAEENNALGTLALALAASASASAPGRQNGRRQQQRRRSPMRFLLRGWARTAIPAWASAADATPASVRDPPAPLAATTSSSSSSTAAPASSSFVGNGAKGLSTVRAQAPVADAEPAVEARAERAVEALASRAAKRLSASGGSGAHAEGVVGAGGVAPLMHQHATGASASVPSRYKDLEDFLDDDDDDMEEIEVELDAPALEDEECGHEYDDDDDDEEEEVEEGQYEDGGGGGGEETRFAGAAGTAAVSRPQLPHSEEANEWV